MRLAPRHTPPVPADEARFVARRVPPARSARRGRRRPPFPLNWLPTDDLIAELAVRGPFASYLRRRRRRRLRRRRRAGSPATTSLPAWRGSAARPRLQGSATAASWTETVEERRGRVPTRRRSELLAGTQRGRSRPSVTTCRCTSRCSRRSPSATTNDLAPERPVRRLLHHCFNTVLIGNFEQASAQLSGHRGFGAKIFSHHGRRVGAHDRRSPAALRLLGLRARHPVPEPRVRRRRRSPTRTATTCCNCGRRRTTTSSATSGSTTTTTTSEEPTLELAAWTANSIGSCPTGIGVPDSGPTLKWLGRLCATVIHVSTVEHDLREQRGVELGDPVAGSSPPSCRRRVHLMDQRRALELIATYIATWKPYNMLLTADVPALTLTNGPPR